MCVGNLSYPACKAHVPNYSHMAYVDLPCFTTLSHKQHNFHKIVTEHKMHVSIFSITFVSNISHCKKKFARYYHKCTCLHVKYPLFLSDFNESSIVLTCFLKNTQTPNFMKIHPVVFCPLFDCLFNYETCSFHAPYETKLYKPEAHIAHYFPYSCYSFLLHC